MKGAQSTYMRRLLALGLVAAVASGCAAPLEDDAATGVSSALGDAEADAILFPGDRACGGGCESTLASGALFIPDRGGRPWGDTYALGNPQARVVAGYSSGRIALLRRLALQPSGAAWAVMVDPSWNDGVRNFAGTPTTGSAIVARWLRGDATRRFMIVFSTSSAGHAEYEALADEPDIGARVKVCSVTVAHFAVPETIGASAITAPEAWDNGRCVTGGGATSPAPSRPPAEEGTCASNTLGRDVPHGTCVERGGAWYVCDATRPAVWPVPGADGAPLCASCPQRPNGACD